MRKRCDQDVRETVELEVRALSSAMFDWLERSGCKLARHPNRYLQTVGNLILERTLLARDYYGPGYYDTREGIARMVTTLEGFNLLLDLRRAAHYDRDETLHTFYIKGRWMVDGCGNAFRVTGSFIPAEKISNLPDVVTREELWDYIEEYSEGCTLRADDTLMWCSMGSWVPPADMTCRECGRPWSIHDCHDVSVENFMKHLPLGKFAGKTFGEVRELTASECAGESRRIYPNLIYRDGDRVDGVNDLYVIHEDDTATLYVWEFFHKACRRKFNARQEQEYFEDIFARAGFENFSLKAVANQYCGCESCAPWFEVSTPIGTILIGWRKRVININWSRSFPYRYWREVGETSQSFLHLFRGEKVTKGRDHIHAWGTEKAIEYLSRMLKAVRNSVEGQFEYGANELGWEIYKTDTGEQIETAEEFWRHFVRGGRIDIVDTKITAGSVSRNVVIGYRPWSKVIEQK